MFTENIFNQKLVGLISVIILLLSSNCQRMDDRIIGVKIYDHQGPFEELVSQWRSLGINTVFSGLSLYSNNKFRSIIKSSGITSFVIVPIFFNPEILDVSPELYAITDKGVKAQDEWVKFVCPSRMEYRRQKITEVENIIREFDPDGLSIDFIRHFVFWEKIYPDRFLSSLPNTCFDSICTTAFQADNHFHVEHAVRFVQHEQLHRTKVYVVSAREVQQAPWRRDEHIQATFERPDLGVLIHAPKDHEMPMVKVPAVGCKALSYLNRQLSGGCQHEHERAIRRRFAITTS